ncbi:hypothetical protein GCE86_09745 [Micromonospora terminaliae]|uniref:histidine kinase n=1 Tax=Micromonospora terminaliae TaxID=1914461 RepID=A0AAJ2ZFD8_9ACTN|nr:GAF domain-containing sensor histidine kinase [Micromonospora terminaliae]NES27944.1 GAF domain-containing sensor histidine kinase [Micromonospora terminaliae]QGL47290.1 hypothetical protein GCE86_09745 [Micromonospora terminaliae]
MRLRRPLVAPAVVAGVTVMLSTMTLWGVWSSHGRLASFLSGNQANTWVAGLAFGVVGALVLRRQPANRLGWVLGAAGLCAAASSTAAEYVTYTLFTRPGALPGAGVAALAVWLWLPAFLLMVVALPLLFPDGRLRSPGWRAPAAVALTSGTVAIVGIATVDQVVAGETGGAYHNPLDLPLPDGPQLTVVLVAFFVAVAVGAVAVVAVVLGMRRAEPARRRQDAWFVAALALILTATQGPWSDVVTFALHVAAVAALTVGVVRHQLFDIETVLSRALVYALLTGVALAAYLLAAAALGANLGPGVGPALVAAVAALLLAGVRHRVQLAVERLLYGRRDDPLAALTSFGERLAQTMDVDAVLPAVVDTVRATLRLPYAAVRLTAEATPAYTAGEPIAGTVEFPLTYSGEPVGVLIVGPRRGEQDLSPADRRLLEAFARQAGVAAHGVRVTRDLRRSRERVIMAREEERLRIRRELHDGMGPALAGITLGLETAARRAHRDGPEAGPLLAELREQCAACVEEVRRIVADLRPPTLDQGGLVDALRRHAEVFNAATTAPTVLVEEDLPGRPYGLPAAVEVAAYRIALEAMTNAVRHAGARTCRVSVSQHDALLITVWDDGSGVAPAAFGVGLASMRERAEELGGRCTVTFRQGQGTQVEAVLPVVAS